MDLVGTCIFPLNPLRGELLQVSQVVFGNEIPLE
jgi:hypothetical protein